MNMMNLELHPVFDRFQRTAPYDEYGLHYNFVGASVRLGLERPLFEGVVSSGRCTKYDVTDPTYPHRWSEDYFEWVDLLTAVDRARGRFTMIDVGAGYGRWTSNALAAIRRHKVGCLGHHIIAIEPEPMRYAALVDGVAGDPDVTTLNVGVTAEDGDFGIPSNDDYGAGVGIAREGLVAIGTVRLQDLIREPIDFLDMDIQGHEVGVIPGAIAAIDQYVKLAHIATHGKATGDCLARLFDGLGWKPRYQFEPGAEIDTPLGPVGFIDGIQSWENPVYLT